MRVCFVIFANKAREQSYFGTVGWDLGDAICLHCQLYKIKHMHVFIF